MSIPDSISETDCYNQTFNVYMLYVQMCVFAELFLYAMSSMIPFPTARG